MKKISISFIVCSILMLSFVGCKINKNNFDIGEKSNIEVTEKDIVLSIKENTLTKKGATLILKNNSNNNIQYGTPYEIEIKKDNVWHKIDVQLNFNMPVFVLKPSELEQIELNWEAGYGELDLGEYRIIKSIDIEKDNETFERYYISAEFTIK